MTTSAAARELARRKAQLAGEATFAYDLNRELKELIARATRVRFPNPKYQTNPVAFFREVLGLEPWDKQVEIIEAVRDHMRVAVCSGHKVGKSTSIAGIALWFYCSFPDARAIMSSTTARQVDQILWRELRMMLARSGRCVDCKAADPEGYLIPKPCPHSAEIDGLAGELARTGLKSGDFREVVGFTAKEAEAVAGISGRSLIYLLDEASGIPDVIYHAIEGNRAGGARVVLVGNGTRNEGEFFEAFHSKSGLYKTLRVSSEQTPNVIHGRHVIPGLATREWIDEKKLEWGEDSPIYRVRVKGEHAIHEAGRIFSLHSIAESERRWHDTPEAGRLFIGLDPAGESGTGDETVFVARRGLRMIRLQVHIGLTEDAHLVHLLGLIRSLRVPRETPVVVLDREGGVGYKLAGVLRAYVERHPESFELVTLKVSAGAKRQPQVYDRLRDELTANLQQWFRDGGAILEDAKLTRELHAFEWKQSVNGKLKITPKDAIRKQIGRSPDRYDALSYACWEPLSLRASGAELPAGAEALEPANDNSAPGGALDPYAGADAWQRGA